MGDLTLMLPWGSAPLGSGLPSCKRHRSALVLNHNQALAGSKWETGDLTLYLTLYFVFRAGSKWETGDLTLYFQ